MSDPLGLGPVVITAREIYDAVMRLTTAVERLADDHQDVMERLRDHETRLRSLERGRWPLPAVTALVSVAALVLAALAMRGG